MENVENTNNVIESLSKTKKIKTRRFVVEYTDNLSEALGIIMAANPKITTHKGAVMHAINKQAIVDCQKIRDRIETYYRVR